MGLSGALQIGRMGLLASQAAIEVAGNNLANIATRGYHRQEVTLVPARSQAIGPGVFVGRGVLVQQIVRQIDDALEGRLRTSISDQSQSLAQRGVLSQIEAIYNEFSGVDLSTRLGAFFNAWSELANNPQDNSLRSLVIQEGATLASFIQTLRSDLVNVRTQVDRSIDAATAAADNLLTQIEGINLQIVNAEGGTGSGAHGLRDQRDTLLAELAQFIDISTVEQPSGVVDVFVGSTPIILNGRSRGLEVRRQTVDGQLQTDVVVSDDGTVVNGSSGQIGALVSSREQDINQAIQFLDDYANQLIFQVNRLHSQGQGLQGHSTVTATSRVLDTTVALNDPDAGLDFVPTHGSFRISVTQQSTGHRVTSTISVDLDGINPAGDTTLVSLAAAIDALADINATITADGRLQITGAGSDFEVSFSDDTSGVLAALGINTFFTGSTAFDMGVNDVILAAPVKLAAALEHLSGDNRTALALAALRDESIESLGGLSLTEMWHRHVQDYAVRLSQAQQHLEADSVVRESLQAQQQQVSGVNADEEAIDLLGFQRAYQGSARFIAVVDEMLQTLLALL
ncbi:MAG: flagellar hook-associated protein FlgK [Phycisphaeraceae bacterium]